MPIDLLVIFKGFFGFVIFFFCIIVVIKGVGRRGGGGGGGSVLGCYERVPDFTDTQKRITFGTKCNIEHETMH